MKFAATVGSLMDLIVLYLVLYLMIPVLLMRMTKIMVKAQELYSSLLENIKMNPVTIIKTAIVVIDLVAGLGTAVSKLPKVYQTLKPKKIKGNTNEQTRER